MAVRDFTGWSQVVGTADGYSTLSGTTETYSTDVDLGATGLVGALIDIGMDFDVSPTDDVTMAIYPGRSSTYAGTELPYQTVKFEADDGDFAGWQVVVEGLDHFRIGFVQSGSTDSHDVRAYVNTFSYPDAL